MFFTAAQAVGELKLEKFGVLPIATYAKGKTAPVRVLVVAVGIALCRVGRTDCSSHCLLGSCVRSAHAGNIGPKASYLAGKPDSLWIKHMGSFCLSSGFCPIPPRTSPCTPSAQDCIGEWSAWSTCFPTCGRGTTTRGFRHLRPRVGVGKNCEFPPNFEETKPCLNYYPCYMGMSVFFLDPPLGLCAGRL